MDNQNICILHQDGYYITWLAPLYGTLGTDRDSDDNQDARGAFATTRIIAIGNNASRLVHKLHQQKTLNFDSYWRYDYVMIDSALPVTEPFFVQETDTPPISGVTKPANHLASLTKGADAVIYVIESESQLAQKLLTDPFFNVKNDASFTVAVFIGRSTIDNTFERQLACANSIYFLAMDPTDDALDYLGEFIFTLTEPYTGHGLICVDIADVLVVVDRSGLLHHSWCITDNAEQAAKQAINAFSSGTLRHASGAIILVTGSESLSLEDFTAVGDFSSSVLNDDSTVVVAVSIDPEYGNNVKVGILLAGG